MGKHKKRKKEIQSSRPEPRRAQEPTAFELAYKQATSKKNDASEINVALPTAKISKPAGQKNQSATHQPLPRKKQVQSSGSKKKATATPHYSVKKRQNQATVSTNIKKKAPIKLGLKRESEKNINLNTSDTFDVRKNCSHIKSQKIQSVAARSQVHGGKITDESDIVIGFDFGTSSSKVVIRDSGRQTAYAIPFDFLACSNNKYLIPTRIFINDDGAVSLSKGDYSCSNLKIHLMDDPDQNVFTAMNTGEKITATELAAGYMAIVILLARARFLQQTESIYKKTRIHWHINIGIPSKNYDDRKMRKSFKTIAMAAWRISRMDTSITISEIKKYLMEAKDQITSKGSGNNPDDNESLWLHPDFVNTHPEVIMEVVGYARSPLRTNGLHLIVDIGATTLDTATFIIHDNEGEDVFPILDSAVERLGTIMLHHKRVQALKASLEQSLREVNDIDPTIPLPDHNSYGIQLSEENILENDNSFFKECSTMIGNAMHNTKRQRDPNSEVWQTELPVFICGGGGRHASYRKTIDELGQRCANAWDYFRGFTIKDIPKPNHLDAPDLPHEEYDRLAVAYGLSFTSDEIGEVIPASKISNIKKQTRTINVEDRYISKDMC